MMWNLWEYFHIFAKVLKKYSTGNEERCGICPFLDMGILRWMRSSLCTDVPLPQEKIVCTQARLRSKPKQSKFGRELLEMSRSETNFWLRPLVMRLSAETKLSNTKSLHGKIASIYREYYTVARRYEFHVRVRYCSCHENIKFISSS